MFFTCPHDKNNRQNKIDTMNRMFMFPSSLQGFSFYSLFQSLLRSTISDLCSFQYLFFTGVFKIIVSGRDTRNALCGRKPVATRLKQPYFVHFQEVATVEASSRADFMERPPLPAIWRSRQYGASGSVVIPATWRTALRSIDAVLHHRGTITLSAYKTEFTSYLL